MSEEQDGRLSTAMAGFAIGALLVISAWAFQTGDSFSWFVVAVFALIWTLIAMVEIRG
jgi:hypothetical protein